MGERTAISIKIFGQITAPPPPHCAPFVVIITRRGGDRVFVRSSHLSNERKSRLVSNDPPTHLHTRLFPRRVHNGKAYVNSSLQEEHFSLSLSPSTLLRLPFVAFSLLTNNQEGTFGRSHINLVNSLDSVLVRISSIAKRLVAFFPTYEMKSPEGNLRVLLRPVSYNEVQPMC